MMASLTASFDFACSRHKIMIFSVACRKHSTLSFTCLSGEECSKQRRGGIGSGTISKRTEEPVDKSRGELFLEKALKLKGSKLSEGDKRRDAVPPEIKHKVKKKKESSPKPLQPVCYGCGAVLQTENEEAPGFVPLDTYLVKKKHHQLRTVLCGRCHLLSHGHMIPAVGGHGGYAGEKRFILAEQLRLQLSHLRNEKALIIKLVDIVDFNGSFITRIRDIVGANPIILVVTKIDLLPRNTDLDAIGDWIVESTLRKKLNVMSVHLTSAKSLSGISGVASYLRQHRQGRDVYILGSANVGKSAFVSAILQAMAQKDLFAFAAMKHMPVQSSMPGTTLGPIEIKAFSGSGSLFDTPGIHVHHRMTAIVAPEDLNLLGPRRRLRGYYVSPSTSRNFAVPESRTVATRLGNDTMDEDSCSDTEADNSTEGASCKHELQGCLAGMSILWGGIIRLDIIKAPPNVGARLFGPNVLPICAVPTTEVDGYYKEELGKKLTPPTNVDDWKGLQGCHEFSWVIEAWDRPVCDIAFSGVGWITIEPDYSLYFKGIEAKMDEVLRIVQVKIHVPRALEIFSRPPLPVGVSGSEWYEYRELTDEELQTRPRVFLP